MAKGKKKGSGPGRGRKNPPRDPKTGRLLGKTPEPTPSGSTVVSAPEATKPTPKKEPTAEMKPAGSTELPKEIEKDISGFRKAMTERLKELGETESGVQEAVLDGLRDTAEQLVQQNADIFGKRGEKTVDQSAAYEVIEGVVALGEQAAAAKTVEQKRKILQRLKTYKSVVEKVIVGKDPRLSAISGKILEMIDNIEKPLSRESGMRAAAKEKITEFAKRIPERAAAKIPLIGGILSRSLQRRREKKEEEASALSDLTQQISRAGRSSLYGKRGEAMGAIPSIEPPISGMSAVSDIMPTPTEGVAPSASGVGFSIDNDTIKNIADILVQVKDIKEFIIDRFDSATEETKTEEARREEEDRLFDLARKQKDKTGKIVEGAEKKGILDSLLGLFDGGISGMVKQVTGALGGVASSISSTLAGIALPAMGVLAAAAGGAAIGYMINEKWIKPWWDEQDKKDKRTFQKMGSTGQKTVGQIMRNEKGEAMYMVGEGKDREVMSESELDQKIKSTTDEKEKQKYQEAMKKGPMAQFTDVKTGIAQNQDFKQGETTETFRERLRAKKQAEEADPGGVDFNKFADQAAIIENNVRTALPDMEKLQKPEADGMAMSFASDAITLYHRVKNNKRMSNEQKEMIYKISPLVRYLGSNYEKVSDMTGAWDAGGGPYFELKRGIGVDTFKWDESKQQYELVEESQEYKDRFAALKRRSDINKSTDTSIPDSDTTMKSESNYPDIPPLPPIQGRIEPQEKTYDEIHYGGTGTPVPSASMATGTPVPSASMATGTPVPSASMANELPSTSTSLGTPPVQGKIEPKPLSDNIGTSSENNPIKAQIDTIRVEMNKLDTQASRISPPVSLEEMNQINSKRKELNTKRQDLYKKLYANAKPSELPTASISAPSTTSTDVGKATASLERARNDVEMAQATQSAPPANQTLVSTNNSGNTSTVNITNPAPTGVRNPDAVNADRGLH